MSRVRKATQESERTMTDNTWQPIETAPRDGTQIIVAVPSQARGSHIVGSAYYDPKNYGGTWWWSGSSVGDYFASCIEDGNDGPPTHWMPLPPAPGAQGVTVPHDAPQVPAQAVPEGWALVPVDAVKRIAWMPIAEATKERRTSVAVDLWGLLTKDQYKPCVRPHRITNCRYRLHGRSEDSYWGWFTQEGEQVAATHFMAVPARPISGKVGEGAELAAACEVRSALTTGKEGRQ